MTASNSRLEDVWPLSPLQEGLLFQATLADTEQDVYTVQTVLTLDGPLDVGKLRGAAQALVTRHANLRAAFRYRSNGQPVALIARQVEVPWSYAEVSESDADRLQERAAAEPFDLARPPLLRFSLLRIGPEQHRLVITNHHILLDGWSMPLLVRELFALYGAKALPRVKPYRDYLTWLTQQDRAAAEAAWAQALAGVESATRIAPDNGGTATPATVTVDLPEVLTTRLAATARRLGLTQHTIVSGTWALLLSRLLGRDDVVFGTTVSGRPPELPGVDGMIGLFINTVPVRIRIDEDASVATLLTRIQGEQAELLPHQHLGLTAIQRIAGIGELFDTLAVFENYPFDPDGVEEPAPGLKLSDVGGGDATHYPLTLTVLPGARLRLDLGYRPDVLSREDVETIATRLQRLFDAIATDADQRVAALDILSAEERAEVLGGWAGPARTVDASFFHEIVAHQAAQTPAAVAVVAGDTRCTFRDLDERANRLARMLIAHAGPERQIALALPRTADVITAMLATLKAGAAFLPIDADLPVERIAVMLEDAAPTLVLTTSELRDRLPQGTPVLLLDRVELADHAAHDITDADRIAPLRPHHPAYVLYTSGSTGKPKGVVIEHHSLANLFANHETALFTPEARGRRLKVALTAAMSFDTSWEGPLAMAAGHELHVVDDETRRDPEALVEYVVAHRIDLLDLTPSFAQQVFAAGLLTDPRHRPRVVMLGGEAVTPALWEELRAAPDTTGYNFYGPTECTVDTLSCRLDVASPIVGRPLLNTGAYVLDARLRPVPPGVTGELYLIGAQLGRGYLNLPDLTAERFVADPYGVSGSRMYRTGDLCRWRTDGTLEYVGRADAQVKIRGFRIELGEIEAVLAQHLDVAQAAVVARADGGITRLVGYVVPVGDDVDSASLRSYVAERLPDYMVPAAIVTLPALPLTHSGKLDQKALPEPEFAVSLARPESPVEETLCAAYAGVLGLPAVGVDDDFFDLGGDSIVSIQLVSRARAAGLRIKPRDVFTQRTVRALATVAQPMEDQQELAEDAAARTGIIPLTPIMAALLEVDGPIDRVHQSTLLRAPSGMTTATLIAAVQSLLDRHEMLRARLVGDRLEVPAQLAAALLVTRVEVDQLDEAIDEHTAAAVARLAPRDGVMLQVVWFDCGEQREGRLLIAAHHLVVDGVSWRILIEDLADAWAALDAGRPVPAPTQTTSFRRWAGLLSDRARDPRLVAELPYWQVTLDTAGPLVDQPVDPGIDTTATSRLRTTTLDPERTQRLLTDVPTAFRGNVNDVLLTALALAVARWRQRQGHHPSPLVVNLEGHGREEGFVAEQVDLTRTVGWFTAEYPVRLDVGDGTDIGHAVKQVKQQLRTVPGDGLGYGLLRHLNTETGAELSRLPSPQISFNYLGRFGTGESGLFSPAPESSLLGGGAVGDELPMAYVLDVNAMVRDDAAGSRLDMHWSWPGRLLSEAAIAELAADWIDALDELTQHAQNPTTSTLVPADLPLVSLTADQVNRLATRHPGLVDVLPVTPLAEGLLFHSLAADGVDVYTMQDVIDLAGPLDLDRLRTAAHELLRRHPNLRAAFLHDGLDRPVQVIPRDVQLPWRELDLSALDPAAQDEAADQVAAEERDRRFDLTRPPLMRFVVLRMGEDRHRIVFTCHHVLLDGWSAQLFARELFSLYADPAALPPARPYRAYLEWLSGQDWSASRRAWADALAGLDQPTRVATSAVPTQLSGRTEAVAELPTEITEQLTVAARSVGVTLNTLLQLAWALTLTRLTGRNDIVFGQTVAGRPADVAGAESMVGLFINTVPVRVKLRPDETLRALLTRLQDEQTALMAHQHIGLSDIQCAAGLGQLFDTLVVVESYPVDETARREPAPGLHVVSAQTMDATHYPLTLAVVPGQKLGVHLEYQPGAFDQTGAQEVLAALVRILEDLPTTLDQPIARVQTTTAEERQRVLIDWNDNALPVAPSTVPQRFAEQVARTPDAIALEDAAESLTFAELDAAANRLAHALVARGVAPEHRVALLLPRSAWTVVALLAVMKAGGAYVPIDPAYPYDRIAAMLADAAPRLVITTSALAARAPDTVDALVLDECVVAPQPATAPDVPLLPRHPAYVIYTSGSTGRPKGVVVTHQSVVNLFHSHCETLYRPTIAAAGGRQLRVGHTWSFAFDASWQPQLWMLDGHTLHIVDEETLRDPALLVELVREQRLDFIEVSPSLAVALAAEGLIEDGRSPLLALGVGGEAVPALFWQELGALRGTECFNLYGPTETTVDALAARVRDSAEPLVGRPTANTQAYVLDARLQPVAPGVVGELYLGGAGLARGYLNRAALTAERFIADPFGPSGARMYRTGDLVRWTADGAIDYLGRADDQVKVRGFRIELGEIAAVLSQHDDVSQAVVAVQEVRPGDRRIVAYVVPTDVDVAALRTYTASRLPDYMVPSAFVPLGALPLTPHGKVDRAALPAPSYDADEGRAPETPLQKQLCDSFADVLGVPTVSLDDNLFDLGGNSLLLVRLRARIAEETGHMLPIATLFANPTPTLLDEHLIKETERP